jgi:hypothetical protein
LRIAAIRHQDLGGETADPEQRDIDQHRSAGDESQGIAHRRDIGSNVNRVGNEQQPDHEVKRGGGQRLAQIGREPFAGHRADPSGHHLDCDHERRR